MDTMNPDTHRHAAILAARVTVIRECPWQARSRLRGGDADGEMPSRLREPHAI
jgi:hypothetical protein